MPETRHPRTAAAVAAQLPSGFTTRFAPAPTGHLHLGHLVSALWVWGLARARGGRVLLRVEDHDRGRSRAEYERSILDDLDWLGLTPDGVSTADFRAGATEQRQSDRIATYESRLRTLESTGRTYPCRCSRSEIVRAMAGREGVGAIDAASAFATAGEAAGETDASELRYPGTCRTTRVDPAESPARRAIMEPDAESVADLRLGPLTQDPASQCGDLLLRDRNGNFTYQFAVVVDDLDQDVTVVIRGEDLLPSCGRQQRLGALLGRVAAPIWVHHPLVLHPDGRKLSKSAGDTGVRELRAAGRAAAEVLGLAAHASGLLATAAPLSASDVAELFA